MTGEDVLHQQIDRLENDLKRTAEKLQKLGNDGGMKAVGYLVDIEKYKFAIAQLYVCLGRLGK